jgi:hypothetical protein
MGRIARTVTGSTEAGQAMAAPTAGLKRALESRDLDQSSKKKLESGQNIKAMLLANSVGSQTSPCWGTPSTRASSTVAGSPLSILESPLAEPVSKNDSHQLKNMVDDLTLEEELEVLKQIGVSPFAASGSSEAACEFEIMSDIYAPSSKIASPESVPLTPLSVAPAVPSSWTATLENAEGNLLLPAPSPVAQSIGTDIETDEKTRRWGKLADDGFDLRCGPGRRFTRDKDANTEEYKSASLPMKAEFRKQWAKNIYQSMRKVQVKSVSWSKIDVSKGTYMSFGTIVREEGDDEDGLKAAVNYVKACQKMAGVWAQWNLMTKRWEFLYMRQEVQDIFQNSWRMFEEQQQVTVHQKPDAPALGQGASAVTGSTEDAVEAVGKQKNNISQTNVKDAVTGSTEGAAGKKKPGQLKPKTSPDCKKNNPFEVALLDALATRKIYMAVSSKAALVTEQINTNEGWAWARGHYQEELEIICATINELATTGFARLFLMQELKDVKKEYTSNDLLTHSLKFCKEFDNVLTKAQKLLNKLVTMQSESRK